MIRCLIYRAVGGRGGGLDGPIDVVEVPDTAADPETAAWASYTRANPGLETGSYAVFRQGKAFNRRRQANLVNEALGPINVRA